MIISIQINGENFRINPAQPLDISIPLNFNGAQPNAYGVEKAAAKPCETGEIVGDTRRGGSCNFEQYTFIPHCNGTHTECVGHITHERISIRDCLKDVFVPAMLISIEPEKANKTPETYAVDLDENDQLITRTAIERALQKNPKSKIQNPKSIIVRTLPNDESKLTRTYSEKYSAVFFDRGDGIYC
jgi:arylformamidase